MTAGLSAGFDLGGTHLKYGLVDERGAVVFKGAEPTPSSFKKTRDLIADVWRRLRDMKGEEIHSAGFGFPGFFSLEERKILISPNLSCLGGGDLVSAIESAVDAPFRIDNDANLAAYGEWAFGAGRGARSLVLLTVGTGVGSGIILDGRIWHGPCGFAGEIGHIPVNPDGPPCGCGGAGCLEIEVSAPAVVRRYEKLTGRKEKLSAKDIHGRAVSGDAAARESFSRCGYYLGLGLAVIVNFLNPERILLGGGVMAAGDFLMTPALEECRRRALSPSLACTEIRPAELGNDAGFIGAAVWSRNKLS
jgi:glucokinase